MGAEPPPTWLKGWRMPSKHKASTRKLFKAAQMLAEDRLTDGLIAESCGLTLTCLQRWKRKPEFVALVEGFQQEIRRQVSSRGIAQKHIRQRKLDEHAREIESRQSQAEGNKEFSLLSKQYLDTLAQAAKEQGGQFEDKPPAGGTFNHNQTVVFSFPVLSAEDLAAVENAPTVDLPVPARRLLQRPSDGQQR